MLNILKNKSFSLSNSDICHHYNILCYDITGLQKHGNLPNPPNTKVTAVLTEDIQKVKNIPML